MAEENPPISDLEKELWTAIDKLDAAHTYTLQTLSARATRDISEIRRLYAERLALIRMDWAAHRPDPKNVIEWGKACDDFSSRYGPIETEQNLRIAGVHDILRTMVNRVDLEYKLNRRDCFNAAKDKNLTYFTDFYAPHNRKTP
jgi:hypothetical protein